VLDSTGYRHNVHAHAIGRDGYTSTVCIIESSMKDEEGGRYTVATDGGALSTTAGGHMMP
jgi:hypothetical protein